MSDKTDVGRIEGWVEIIVRDKHGKIKYHIGAPPPARKHEEKKKEDKCEDGHNCSIVTVIPSSLPAKLIETAYWRKNVITNVGLACIIRLVFSDLTETKFGYLAIGTGTTAEAVTDTALQAEIKRKPATVSQVTTSVTGDTALLEATFSSADGLTGTSNVSEAGIFNASSGGSLLARKVFSAVPLNWDAGDSITVRYYIQMTR
jgi:hypothetical protein